MKLKKLLKKTKFLVLALAAVSLLGLTACGESTGNGQAAAPAPSPSQSNVKSVVIGTSNKPTVFNPIDATDGISPQIAAVFFQPLLSLYNYTEFVPGLAESVETKDNVTYVAHLNPKAKWTDGTPLTADDVLFSIELITNKNVISSVAAYYKILEGLDDSGKLPEGKTEFAGVKKIDDHTLEFRTKYPVDISLFNENISIKTPALPRHVLKDAELDKLNQNPFFQAPNVTYGPFKYTKYEKDQYVELDANKDYYLGAPKLDKLFFKIVPSTNLVAQLQNEEVHLNLPGQGNIPVADHDKAKALSNIQVQSDDPTSSQFLYINTKSVPDPRVRQAFAYAINREMIVTNLLKGDGEISDVPYVSSSPYLNKDLKPIPYDPEKAKQLLKEAGFDFNQTLNFVVPTSNATREQAADIIVQNLADVGVKAQVNKFDITTAQQKGRSHDFDLFIVQYTFGLDPDISSQYATGFAKNYSDYSSPEMDALLTAGQKELDPDKRRAIYNKVQDLIVQDLPQFPVYQERVFRTVNKKVINGGSKELPFLYKWDIQN